jgi:hypothetical protein
MDFGYDSRTFRFQSHRLTVLIELDFPPKYKESENLHELSPAV